MIWKEIEEKGDKRQENLNKAGKIKEEKLINLVCLTAMPSLAFSTCLITANDQRKL